MKIFLLNKLFVFLTNYTPTFDNAQAQQTAAGFLTPLTNFLLWAIPSTAVVASAIIGVKYFLKDEEEREQKPIWKSLQKILIAAVVVMAFPLILRIFGIS